MRSADFVAQRAVLRRLFRAAAVAVLVLGLAEPLFATTIQVGSAKGIPGQSADVCISLSGGAGRVAGVQMDLSWDTACVSADLAGGTAAGGSVSSTAAACRPNPATGKHVQTSVKGSTLKAFFLSITDLRPIPDGELFCCGFTLARSAPSPCCNVNISGVRGSTASGQAITDIAASGGSICAASPPGTPGGQAAPHASATSGPEMKSTPSERSHHPRRSSTLAPASEDH